MECLDWICLVFKPCSEVRVLLILNMLFKQILIPRKSEEWASVNLCRRRLSHNSGAKICFFLLICKLFLNYFSKIFKKVYFSFEIFKKNGFSRVRTHSFLILFFIILIYSYYVSAKNAGNLLKTRNLEKCLWNSW